MSNERPDSPPPPGPLPIRRLAESLINRIAAGEIIHRPASALKELIENSLDAGASTIKVTVKDGGLKLLQIQDNGSGIRKADLPILAERFTTSKLKTFSDLSRLTTYGFRGEALASISHVAHLSVVTKTKDDGCAWRATYTDGALVPSKPGHSADPKACAGNDGTTITAEDLFYNVPTRLAALRSSSEEYARILDVVTKYACHNPKVGFVCKKSGSPSPDVTTPSNSSTSQVIKMLYGASIAKELLPVRVFSAALRGDGQDRQGSSQSEDNVDLEDLLTRTANDGADAAEPEGWAAEVLMTSPNYRAKKMVLLLFINHRLVESPRIKRALEAVYNTIMPKGAHPFVYLSLLVDPRSVDANVHPTKREVHFLNEESIIERICDAMQQALVQQSRMRKVDYQTMLTGGIVIPDDEGPKKKRKGKEKADEMDVDSEVDELADDDGQVEEAAGGSSSRPGSRATRAEASKKTLSQHKVRTSMKDRTLDSMYPVTRASQSQTQLNPDKAGTDSIPPQPQSGTIPMEKENAQAIPESECYLTSVNSLRQKVLRDKHSRLTEIIQHHVFVGIVDLPRSLSLIQHQTKLYLVNHSALAEEFFYQIGVRQFGNLKRVKLEPAPKIRTLISLAVDVEQNIALAGINKEEVINRITDILVMRREMLAEYFSMHLTPSGELESLPLLLRNYMPNLDRLPQFLMRLGPQVNWTDEEECFSTFLRELAYFYIPAPVSPKQPLTEEEVKAEQWQIEHALFRTMRDHLVAPKSLLDRDVVQVASLPDLYRVFERC